MRRFLQDWAHLLLPAGVLIAGLGVFLVIRAAVVPKSFGEYGHYRGAALEMIRQKPVSYAGQDMCVMCHDDQAKVKAAGKHATVHCEACHGPLAKHAEDPAANVPKLPDVAVLCKRCHEQDPAKPSWFPQVVTAEHSGGMKCTECHQPHSPHIATEADAGSGRGK